MEIICKVAKEMTGLSRLLYPFFLLGAFLFGHFHVLEASAVSSVEKTTIPILLIHGTGDRFVPVEMSRKIKAANPEKVTLVEVEDAPHGLSFIKDRKTYEAAYWQFMNQNVKQNQPKEAK